jgi:hypothetical protein
MITIPLHIKRCSDDKKFIRRKQRMHSYAIRKGYKLLVEGKLTKKEIENLLKARFGLVDIEVRSTMLESKVKLAQHKTDIKNKKARIKRAEKKAKELSALANKTDKQKCSLFKIGNKIAFLKDSIKRDITFGGKETLKKISYFSNFRGKTIKYKNGKEIDADKKLKELKLQYHNGRVCPAHMMGEANRGGNRFFDFDFEHKKIFYKPKRGTKIEIIYSCADSYQAKLMKLQSFINGKEASVSVLLTDGSINLTFDDAILSGYALDEKARAKEVEQIDKCLSEEERMVVIKAVYRDYYKKLKTRKHEDKLPNRGLSYDSNPCFLGFAIVDGIPGSTQGKTVYTHYYDLTEINKKLPKDATPEERAKQNDKRIHGICHIWKDIAATMYYFRCGNFFPEKIKFTQDEIRDGATEANRKNYNLWHRGLSDMLINKYCNEQGVHLEPINAAYTSTIGNLSYSYVDCVNSAIEIARRGLSILSGGFYPPLSQETITHAMTRLNMLNPAKSRDVALIKNCNSWVEIHRHIKKTGLRYRASLGDVCLMDDGPNKPVYHSSGKLKHSLIKKIIFN